jgi:hypothetical protein
MFAALLLAATPAAPVPAGVQPIGPPPKVYFVRAATPGDLRVYAKMPITSTVPKTIHLLVNGVKLPKIIQEQQTTYTTRATTLAAAGGRFTTADGQSVPAPTLADRLRDGTVVVVSADGHPIHPAYRAVLRPDALVLNVPHGGYPMSTATGRTGGAPLLLRLTPEADGVVRLPVATAKTETRKVNVSRVVAGNVQTAEEERTVTTTVSVPTAVQNAQVSGTTADGRKLDGAAIQRLSSGGLVLAAGSTGIDDVYLSAFAADVPVLRSPTLMIEPARPTGSTATLRALPVMALPAPPQPIPVVPKK